MQPKFINLSDLNFLESEMVYVRFAGIVVIDARWLQENRLIRGSQLMLSSWQTVSITPPKTF